MLNILIACDHKISRDALTRVLAAQPYFHVIAVCADTHAAISITARERPHIVFVDGSTDPLSAIEATKLILSQSAAGVIALSRAEDPAFAEHMLSAGALGYLTSHCSGPELVAAVEAVAKDNLYSCLDMKYLTAPTPKPVSAIKKAMNSLRETTQQKISNATDVHWHNILKFTN